MVAILCDTPDHLKLSDLKAFQGKLKKRTDSDVKELANSIMHEGLIMPFVVWRNQSGENMLLDGHGRLQALSSIEFLDDSISEQDFPILYVRAETEDEAKKRLLQITSSYGKITKKGALDFCSSIQGYHAPAINKLVHRQLKQKELKQPATEKIIRIAVALDKVDAVIELFKQVEYIRVL